jgi:hypothetical protein
MHLHTPLSRKPGQMLELGLKKRTIDIRLYGIAQETVDLEYNMICNWAGQVAAAGNCAIMVRKTL